MVDRPSKKLADLLNGVTPWDQADESIRSWAQYYIYDAAKQCMAGKNRDDRIKRFSKLPPHIRPRVSAEIRRLQEGR